MRTRAHSLAVGRWAKSDLVGEAVTPATAELLTAMRLATDAQLLVPDSAVIRRLYLSTLAQAIVYIGSEPGAAAQVQRARW